MSSGALDFGEGREKSLTAKDAKVAKEIQRLEPQRTQRGTEKFHNLNRKTVLPTLSQTTRQGWGNRPGFFVQLLFFVAGFFGAF
jgi:hypothetical protein